MSSSSSSEAEFDSSDDELDVRRSIEQQKQKRKQQYQADYTQTTSSETVKSKQRTTTNVGGVSSSSSAAGGGVVKGSGNGTSATSQRVTDSNNNSSQQMSLSSPPLKLGTRVYAEYPPNGQYYWGWIYGYKESKYKVSQVDGTIVQGLRYYYKIYFEDGDTDERVPSHHVFTVEQCRIGNLKKHQVDITKEPSKPSDLIDLLGWNDKTSNSNVRNKRNRHVKKQQETTIVTKKPSKKRQHHQGPGLSSRDISQPVSKQFKKTNTSTADATAATTEGEDKNKATTTTKTKTKQMLLHEQFIYTWNKNITDHPNKERKTLTLQQLYKLRCTTCDLCLAENCGKCISCTDVEEENTTKSQRGVCVHNMCSNLPIECKQQDITTLLFPNSATKWYYAFVKPNPINHLIYASSPKDGSVEEGEESNSDNDIDETLLVSPPKSILVIINHVGRLYRGGLEVLLQRIPEGSYGLTQDDIKYCRIKFNEFYKLIGDY